MKLVLEYILNGVIPKDQKERRKLQRRDAKFCIIDNNLYRRGFTQLLFKCLRAVEVAYVMAEIYERCCGQHSGHKTLTSKILRVDYYWSIIEIDTVDYVRRCEKVPKMCQHTTHTSKWVVQSDVYMDISLVRDWHTRTFSKGPRTGQISSGSHWLLHQMGYSRNTCHHNYWKYWELCV